MKEYSVHIVHNCLDHKDAYAMLLIKGRNKEIVKMKARRYIKKYLYQDYDWGFDADLFIIKYLRLAI